MVEVITAIYEKGILRPLEPLALRERQKVRLQVIPENEREQALHVLVKAGLMAPKPEGPPPPDPVTEQERERLAVLLGHAPGKSLSEIVIEERGEW